MVIAAGRDRFPPTKGPDMPPAASTPPPQRRLHNFTFPTATWGVQRSLRCSKFPMDPDPNAVGSMPSAANPDGCSSSRRPASPLKNTVPMTKRYAGDRYLKEDEGKREEEVTPERSFYSNVDTAAVVEDASEATRPWNLRTRRAACNVMLQNDRPPLPLESEMRCPQTDGANGRSEGAEQGHHQKFSIPLSRKEIEQDFLALKGTKLPRRPKKRPRIVQWQLDSLFPGLMLGQIAPSRYKVDDKMVQKS